MTTINIVKEKQRQHGVVTTFCWGYATEGPDLVAVAVDIDLGDDVRGSPDQMFVSVVAQDKLRDFVRLLSETFGLDDVYPRGGLLTGKRCFALRCWGGDDSIYGIESEDTGKRFTRADWKRHLGVEVPSPFELERRRVNAEIRGLEGRVMERRQWLTRICDGTDWSK